LDTKKRVFIGLVVLCIAYFATTNPAINQTYAGQWVNAAMMVISFYLGSHTEKMKMGEDQGGDGTVGGSG